jgi:hypothetical protein
LESYCSFNVALLFIAACVPDPDWNVNRAVLDAAAASGLTRFGGSRQERNTGSPRVAPRSWLMPTFFVYRTTPLRVEIMKCPSQSPQDWPRNAAKHAMARVIPA